MHHGLICHAGRGIDPRASIPVAAVRAGDVALIVETLNHSDDGAAGIPCGSAPHVYRSPMPGFVVQKSQRFLRLKLARGCVEWTMVATQLAACLIAMRQHVVDAFMAHHFMPQVAGDLLRSVTPQQNSSSQVHDANACLQTLEDRSVGLGILKSRHRFAISRSSGDTSFSSAKIHSNFRL